MKPPAAAQTDATERDMRTVYPYEVDLSDCDVEPLHHIQVVQPYAALVAIDRATMRVTQASENLAAHAGIAADDVLGRPATELLDGDALAQITRALEQDRLVAANPIQVTFAVGDGTGEVLARQLVAHASADGRQLVVEVEPSAAGLQGAAFQQALGRAVEAIQGLRDFPTMFQQTAEIVRGISGYDRVMVYRFDADHNGEVIAEARRDDLEPFLHLRYPASDIPRQARELYLRNRVRLLGDVDAAPARILMAPEQPTDGYLDLSPVACRGLSPIHREYLHNMGVRATMSIAIVLDGKLWGLFAMHHYAGPRVLGHEMRSFLQFLGQVFSGHLALQGAAEYRRRVLEVNVLRSRLGDQLSLQDDIGAALMAGPLSVLDVIAGAHGAAVSVEGTVHTVGRAPTPEQVRELAAWVADHDADPLLYSSDCLADDYPGADGFADVASGVLLVWLERERREYIAWFRQEIIRHVDWGGDPNKDRVATSDGGTRLAPRKSFDKYTQLVRGRSEPWTETQRDAALALRAHVKDVVMRRYQQVRRVNAELATAYQEMESFSYTVSHDLRAPLRGISGYAEILLEDYGQALDDEARGMLRSIRDNTGRMNTFIDELLEVSKVGVSTVEPRELNLARLANIGFADIMPAYPQRCVRLVIADDLPAAYGDPRLVSVALNNLLSNAVKYTHNREAATVELGYLPPREPGGSYVFYVRDDGVGFPQEYAGRVFDMFTRLIADDEVEGSGVGLALVQRVITKHDGEIWAESSPGEGATFYFTLKPATAGGS